MLGTIFSAMGQSAWATPGSMKAFCMSTTTSAVLPGSMSSNTCSRPRLAITRSTIDCGMETLCMGTSPRACWEHYDLSSVIEQSAARAGADIHGVKEMGNSPPTATTVLDSILFRDAFGAPRMREVFSDHALISRYVEVEIALARAQARCGVIPAQAAEQIAAKCNVASLDFDLLRHETDIVGYPILPLVHQLTKQCGDAGRYLHWGATAQDIMDTAVVLQVREGLTIIAARHSGEAG